MVDGLAGVVFINPQGYKVWEKGEKAEGTK